MGRGTRDGGGGREGKGDEKNRKRNKLKIELLQMRRRPRDGRRREGKKVSGTKKN